MIIKSIKSKLEQFVRLVFINCLTPINQSIILVEYPKSGGTWLGQLVSSYFNIPFPRNRFPHIKKSMYHGHYLPKYNITKNKKIILLVRDGRDVMVSLYHHHLLWNNKNKLNPKDVIYHRKNVPFNDYENVKANMSAFIDYILKHKPSKAQHFTYMGNWVEFNREWLDKKDDGGDNIYLIKYEDLLKNTYETMRKMLNEFFDVKEVDADYLKQIVHEFSFENQTKRKHGEEKKESFLRKGIAGDWKNYFDDESEKKFILYSKEILERLDYLE